MKKLLGFVFLGLSACAYYNGLYNANRLANEARKATREGRTGEARSLWAQAAQKAGRVADRFAHSKYHDDALLLEGRAFKESGSCSQGLAALQAVADSSPDRSMRMEAGLLLGQCRMALREPDSAIVALNPVADGPASRFRDEALLWRGRAAMSVGNYGLAWRDLSRTRAEGVAFDRAKVLSALGRPAEARAQLDSLTDVIEYDETNWLSVLDSIGTRSSSDGAELVERLVQRSDLTEGQRARLLLEDGVRWYRSGSLDSAAGRFEMVKAQLPDSLEGRMAETYLAVIAVREAERIDRIDGLNARIKAAIADGGPPTQVAAVFVRVLDQVPPVLTGEDKSDLRLFMVAEKMRDSVQAPALAAKLFRKVQEDYPQSMLAPKALLAAGQVDPAFHDSVTQMLETMYPFSPYTLLAWGIETPSYTAVEDSIHTLLKSEEAARRVKELRRRRERRRRLGGQPRRRGGNERGGAGSGRL